MFVESVRKRRFHLGHTPGTRVDRTIEAELVKSEDQLETKKAGEKSNTDMWNEQRAFCQIDDSRRLVTDNDMNHIMTHY